MGMALGKGAWRLRKGAWRDAMLKLARGNTMAEVGQTQNGGLQFTMFT